MSSLAMVITVCTALAGSPHNDHCRDLRVPVVVDALPAACVAKAQEYVANHPEIFEGTTVLSFGCARRGIEANAGERQ